LDIAQHLKALELDLLSNTTRKNAARVSSLLADGFREFGSSGRVYTKEDIVVTLQEEAPASFSLVNFETRLLAEGVALVTYRSSRDESGAPPSTALRSSIWIREAENWRMVFHQGTKLPSAAGASG
jgi:hypothetical protein